jgi:aryl-alcohol dehydrogenase-like predicted oxidoreductase
VIPWSPLARGLLAGTRRSPADTEATPRAETDDIARKLYDQPGDQAVIDAVRRVAKAHGVTPARVALAWMLSKPVITAPIIGATKLEHLDDALAALELELTAEEINQLEAAYLPHPVRGF